MPPGARYGLALLFAIVGVVASVAWSMFAQVSQNRRASGFIRAGVPGQISVLVDRPATYAVYAEGTLWLRPSLQVSDPAGNPVQVSEIPPDSSFWQASNGGAFAKFAATMTGDYRITVATGATAQGEFAVGPPLSLWIRFANATSFALLALGVAAGGVLAIATFALRRRGR